MKAGFGYSGKILARLWHRGVLGLLAMALAVLACYGVLALAALLPLLGVRLVLDESVWAGAIILFIALTVLAVLPGYRAHGGRLPMVTAVVGAGLILHALLIDYNALVELAGFVALVAAALRDASLHRRVQRSRPAAATAGPAPR